MNKRPQHKIRYLKLREEKVGDSLKLTGTGKDFLNTTPLTLPIKSAIDKWNLMKLKSFCTVKDNII